MLKKYFYAPLFLLLAFSCASSQSNPNQPGDDSMTDTNNKLDTATLGAGCFWCVEAIFQNLEGVHSVFAGYAGGHVNNPTYKQVCDGGTGHIEVAQITFDPAKISFEALLTVFWKTHDPTTFDRQGNDVGDQYRSVIFYHNENQKAAAEKSKQEMDASGYYDSPIVTVIAPLSNYYKAEDYHQDYFKNNSKQPYCQMVIQPKVEKFKKEFKEKLKK